MINEQDLVDVHREQKSLESDVTTIFDLVEDWKDDILAIGDCVGGVPDMSQDKVEMEEVDIAEGLHRILLAVDYIPKIRHKLDLFEKRMNEYHKKVVMANGS